MSTQKKVWMSVAVVAALALLAVPLTANANRQREAAKANARLEVEAARLSSAAEYYSRLSAQAAARQRVREAEAARWAGLAAQHQREYGVEAPEAAYEPLPVYDSTGAREDALRPEPEYTLVPVYDAGSYDPSRALMTAVPGYNPAGPWPTVVPAP
jgi:hypothetical protein